MTFGKILKQLREDNGYTMDKLVEIYNQRFNGRMNKSTLSRYENELQEPMYTAVVNLAKIFNISVDNLLGLSNDVYLNLEKEIIINAFNPIPIITAIYNIKTPVLAIILKSNIQRIEALLHTSCTPIMDELECFSKFFSISASDIEKGIISYRTNDTIRKKIDKFTDIQFGELLSLDDGHIFIKTKEGLLKGYYLDNYELSLLQPFFAQIPRVTNAIDYSGHNYSSLYGEIAAEGGELNSHKKKPETTL